MRARPQAPCVTLFNGARTVPAPKVTRPTDEHSPYAVWCHLNAPPAAVAPCGAVCPCLAAFLVASPGGDLILCPFPGTSASNAVPRATLES